MLDLCTVSSPPLQDKLQRLQKTGHKDKRNFKCVKRAKPEETPEPKTPNVLGCFIDDIYDPNEDYDATEMVAAVIEQTDLLDEDNDDKNYVAFSFTGPGSDHILDSGASKTDIQNKAVLTNYIKRETSMRGAGDNQIIAPGIGELQLNDNIKIKHCLHVPNLAMNLLSVGQRCDLGNTVKFTKTSGIFTDNEKRKTILCAPRMPGTSWNIEFVEHP
jgi:hypothetical protein